MAEHGAFDQGPAPTAHSPQGRPPIQDACRAARIGLITTFAKCLVKPTRTCPHGFFFGTAYYCRQPQQDAIIARTLAAQRPPGS